MNGYKVTSKRNGNSIFLPAASCRYDTSLGRAGSNGSYWSSSLYMGSSCCVSYLYFSSSCVERFPNDQYFGFSVRPVCP